MKIITNSFRGNNEKGNGSFLNDCCFWFAVFILIIDREDTAGEIRQLTVRLGNQPLTTRAARNAKAAKEKRAGCSVLVGMMLNHLELNEFEYVLKKEMEEIRFDLEDQKLDRIVKLVLEERYQVLYHLFCRFAQPADCRRYLRKTEVN
ncbi:hypothetical protein [Fictibacillus barbaricus]|uniref:Uncharacterized protein n=1 Tax=Fictibacillus barbaricus TaxID=182136 RepID=A0ABU1U5U6_9BACL|nr:hypothetical protein [Fictibacillus barbaricus]MDR7074751.1 hypothetical protein [Fictibacillus barbaricus]